VSSSAPARPATDGTTEDLERAFQRRLGARLRDARHARGLTLHEVEERSDGRWKAVVVGSYERGDRAVSAVKLADLAVFYDVELADLLATGGDRGRSSGPLGAMELDARAIERAAEDDPELAPLARLVAHVRWQRGDHRSTVLSVRDEDLRSVALVAGLEPAELGSWLAERGLIAPGRDGR
jgi:transcriptional regulator with XRE-family HTH domain